MASATAAAASNREREMTVMSRIKRDCLAFGVSIQEAFQYLRAMIVGQAKKLKAGNEKEVAAADLQAQKLQVEAADKAEKTKEKIYQSM